MSTIFHTLTHDDVGKIVRLVETLHRSKLRFMRIEAEGLEISISKKDPAIAFEHARQVQGKFEDRQPPPGVPVSSRNVGVFRSAAPKIDRVVQVGVHVDSASVLGFIQTLDDVNAVYAGVVGKVVETCVNDGEFVEFGQRLYRILPSSEDNAIAGITTADRNVGEECSG